MRIEVHGYTYPFKEFLKESGLRWIPSDKYWAGVVKHCDEFRDNLEDMVNYEDIAPIGEPD
jgi:hypothetical protein